MEKVDESVDINVRDLDMNNLIFQKNQDIDQIEKLQKQVEELSGRITLGDVNNLLSIKDSPVSKMSRSGYDFGVLQNMRPTNMTTESQKAHLVNLQLEIERNQAEIELLKQKLQLKN